jgi:hypothetical protein
VGGSVAEAGARLWFLEDRARLALATSHRAAPPVAATDWLARSRHVQAELERAAAWFSAIAATYTATYTLK